MLIHNESGKKYRILNIQKKPTYRLHALERHSDQFFKKFRKRITNCFYTKKIWFQSAAVYRYP